jgi:hypothetical protein
LRAKRFKGLQDHFILAILANCLYEPPEARLRDPKAEIVESLALLGA